MKLNDYVEYVIPAWALSPMVNGDETSIDEEEIKSLNAFEAEVHRDFGSIGIWEFDDESHFSHTNDVTSCGGDVVDAKYHIYNPDLDS